MALSSFLSKIISWLRAGYPEGVPDIDYIPLFALLGRQLTEPEVRQVADELAASGDARHRQAIHDAISCVTHEAPREADIDRVRGRLAAGGWPLAWPLPAAQPASGPRPGPWPSQAPGPSERRVT